MATKKFGRFEVGKAYFREDPYGGNKYYLQREHDVLMVNTLISLINMHNCNRLTELEDEVQKEVFIEVEVSEVENAIREAIFNLGIYEFIKSK